MKDERAQVAVAGVGLLVLVLLGAVLLAYLGQIAVDGGRSQRAADLAAIAAADLLASRPDAPLADLEAAADEAAAANGGHLRSLRRLDDHGVPAGVEVGVAVPVEGRAPGAGGGRRAVLVRARAGVEFSARLPERSFRPVDLHGASGRAAVVAAAEAQIGWPYVWGGESRAEGGFDCSGLVDFAYAAAGVPLPGRPTAAELWHLAQPISTGALAAGDLVFLGAPSGAPYHVGLYAGEGMVVVAPHTGASVRFEPLSAGAWDGFARLLAAPPRGGDVPDDVERAARRAQAPSGVLREELALGLARDPDAAAVALAAAQQRHHGDLEAALADALGSRSAAALVLRGSAGPEGSGFAGSVRLLPRPDPSPGSGAGRPDESSSAGGLPGHRAPGGGAGGGGAGAATALVGALLSGAEKVAEQLSHLGRPLPAQGAAALRNAARFSLIGAGLVLHDRLQQDAAGLAGSAWDAAASARALAEGGLAVGRFGLWAARLNVVGGLLSTGAFALAAVRARSRRERVVNGALAVGSGLATAGMLTTGSSLLAVGAAGAAVPPLGCALMVAGAAICAGALVYRHWAGISSRVSRLASAAWRLESAPARLALGAARAALPAARRVAARAAAAGHAAAGAVANAAGSLAGTARSLVSSLPTPW